MADASTPQTPEPAVADRRAKTAIPRNPGRHELGMKATPIREAAAAAWAWFAETKR